MYQEFFLDQLVFFLDAITSINTRTHAHIQIKYFQSFYYIINVDDGMTQDCVSC